MSYPPKPGKGVARTYRALITVLAIILLPSSGIVSPRSGARADDTATPATATAGILTPVGVVNPLQLRNSADDTILSPAQARPRGTRPTRPLHPALSASSALPRVSATGLEGAPAGALLSDFNGVSSQDSAVTNFGAEFEPPDQGLCVGNGFVIDAVNSAFTIYQRNGSVVAGPFNVNALFGEGLKEFTSDPRCYYDRTSHTWFAIILFINSSNTQARTDIAVNTSGDPTTPWTVYHLNATDDGSGGTPQHPGCPCFGDQPLLGIDRDNLYISTNEFSILGPQFNGAQVYAIARAPVSTVGNTVRFVHFSNLTIGGAPAASVQPATTDGAAPAEYFLNALDPFGTFDHRIGVWAITNRQVVASGGMPTLSNVVIGAEPYGIPPGASQKGAPSLLDAGDDRMQQVQFIGGHLWGALDTGVTIPNDTAPRAGIAWFKVLPILEGQRLAAAVLRGQGYVAAQGNDLLYPAIQANRDGAAAMVFTLCGPAIFPSAAYTVMVPEAAPTTFGPIRIAAAGTGPYDPAATRWGDYSAAVLDPGGTSFWFATEYIPPPASQTTDGLRNWGTRVFNVAAGS